MTKLLIVLLAVCLVSVHGFVKRDAPTTEKNVLVDLKNNFQDFTKKINEEASKVLNPDELRKNANSLLEEFSKAIDEMKNKITPTEAKE